MFVPTLPLTSDTTSPPTDKGTTPVPASSENTPGGPATPDSIVPVLVPVPMPVPVLPKEPVGNSHGASMPTGTVFYAPGITKAPAPTTTSTSTCTSTTTETPVSKPVSTTEAVHTDYIAPKATSAVPTTSSAAVPAHAYGNVYGGSSEKVDTGAYLKAHNDVRARHGASPLVWAPDLAAAAAKWAEGCVWNNSTGKVGAFGENLAAGAGLGAAAAVKMWTDESSKYNPADPVCASHFTQVVWKATTQVGCAVKSCNNLFPNQSGAVNFHVCEYRDPGNIDGQYANNVQV
ncbi:unnamed protein product [Rhizoctonia solani]|uniref:SCP domain-containing protein n=1 Tax=Rhizoctonia solani TaxID=456999 RepID=A0A8H3HTQ2_9AGAM|nr:unnamed protein product [Rhizoctonia solani]